MRVFVQRLIELLVYSLSLELRRGELLTREQRAVATLCDAARRYLGLRAIVAKLHHRYEAHKRQFIIPRYFILQHMITNVSYYNCSSGHKHLLQCLSEAETYTNPPSPHAVKHKTTVFKRFMRKTYSGSSSKNGDVSKGE